MAIIEDRKLLERALDYVLAEDAGLYAEACKHAGIKPKAVKVEKADNVTPIAGATVPEGSDLNTPPPAA